MYGAILGDIIGSPFEFDRGDKTKNFELFTHGAQFTDDSVMTVAVAEALIQSGPNADADIIRKNVVACMQRWGRRYPHAGYGGNFRIWLKKKNPKPYGSYGNGSAMRVSAAGWLYKSLERTREVARATADVTHNHPEGIKGAEATASCIYLARNGKTKDDIKIYIEEVFGYDLNRTLEEIRPHYHHVESCQETVPEAIIAFLESDGFEDAIRNAVSLGGDTDTLAAITGSIAEAFYGLPLILQAECQNRIPKNMKAVVDEFDTILGRNEEIYDGRYEENRELEMAIEQLYEKGDDESFKLVIVNILERMLEDGACLVPFVTVEGEILSEQELQHMKKGDEFTLEKEVRMQMETVMNEEGKHWLCLFTNEEEHRKKPCGNVVSDFWFVKAIEMAYRAEDVEGLVINPFGKYFNLDKSLLEMITANYKRWKEKINYGENN